MKKAYFVKYPKTYKDLQDTNVIVDISTYKVVKTIELDAIDYENFIYGMDADRQFIEDCAALCSDAPIKRCILVKTAQLKSGILIIPDPQNPSFVFKAAYIPC